MLFRLIASFMLATVGLHAAPSSAATIARGSGSAFDPTTFEVATWPARRIALAAETALPAPPSPSDDTVSFACAPVEAPQPTRFDDEDALRRLRFIGGAILRIAAGLLVMLAVAEMLQRLAVMNIGMFPNR